MDIQFTNPAELTAWAKAQAAGLKGNTEAIDKLAADFGAKFRALEEKQAFGNFRETVANGKGDYSKFVGQKGAILRNTSEEITFGGLKATVEREGLFFAAPEDDWHRDLLRMSAARSVARSIRGKGNTPELDKMILGHVAKAPRELRSAIEKAVNDTTGYGAEWIPDVPISTLYEEFFVASGAVGGLFATQTISGPVLIPSITDTGRPYLKGKVSTNDPAQYTASDFVSSNQTIDPAGFAARFLVDDSAAESAIFALMPEITRRAAKAINDGYEDCVINGDTAATHQDAIASWNLRSRWGSTGLGGSADHRRGFIGRRALAYDRSMTTDQGATQTASGLLALVGTMGELGMSNVALVTSPEVYLKKLLADTSVLTYDKMGPMATLLTGQLASVGGHPIIVSRWMGSDLAATGLYTASGALSGVIAVSTDQFTNYQVRGTMVEQDKDITRGAYNVVATTRKGLYTLSSSTSKVVAFGFNWLS